ncbi:MAG: thioredoxin domain-containing protein [Gammaproteobacteria bacterium]
MDKPSPGAPTNRLAQETSPYLQQHAHNPVDWYPWGPEALELAKAQGKPILLSIGYSACHWCHVMAHESFEDEATARLMNAQFVNIKVDREERPDIDRIYQVAQQMITQRNGGWPLTMFLSHEDQRPFFGGTYFPKEPRYGMPAFTDLLKRVAEYYGGHEDDLRQQNEEFMKAFDELVPPPVEGQPISAEPLGACREVMARNFDSNYGGFGSAPKFPQPKQLERLLRHWYSTAAKPEVDLQALYMATLTLTRMGEGGVYDQIAGGFCRYSVDSHWMIPHFEKMLYDNAGLMAVYAEAAIATGDMFYAQIAAETAEWLIRDMQSPEGGFYSSLDADSEGHEGKFYVWDREEVKAALTAEEFSLFEPRYGLDRSPNFEGKGWHLHVFRSLSQVAGAVKAELPHAVRVLNAARVKLLNRRENRVSPGRDEKILTSWNAMAIRGMAITARMLARDDLAEAATRALDFIRTTLWKNGRLLATYKDGRAHLNAYLDDYVYLADAILELQQVRFRADELAFARELLDVTLAHFEDPQGGFFFTSDDHEALIHRIKAYGDDAIPSGNGIAAFVLQRMGYLLGETRYLTAADRAVRASWKMLERYPTTATTMLNALEELLTPPEIVILRGERKEARDAQRELAKIYAPHRLVLSVPSDAKDLPPAIAEKRAGTGLIAYLCTGSVCSAPIGGLSALAVQLRLK